MGITRKIAEQLGITVTEKKRGIFGHAMGAMLSHHLANQNQPPAITENSQKNGSDWKPIPKAAGQPPAPALVLLGGGGGIISRVVRKAMADPSFVEKIFPKAKATGSNELPKRPHRSGISFGSEG